MPSLTLTCASEHKRLNLVYVACIRLNDDGLTLKCHVPADLYSLLDLAKMADSLVFVLDPTEGWDSYGDYCLSCLFAQGLPSHGKNQP